jgi:uncharacterized repeat protein (TIGR01451 family)
MFKKIVSNLPFNPSMITALGFYGDRLKKEKSVRRLSFVFIALTMIVQMLVVASPPQKSLASSPNHILDGLSRYNSTSYNKNFLLQSWDNNADVRAIYSYFGVTRADLSGMVADKIFSQEADYWTTGRNSLSGYSNVDQKYKNSQITIEYAPGKNIYMRELKAWDIVNRNGQDKYGLKGTIGATGETFWILYDCGNFTKIGKYIPPPPPPPPKNPLSAVCSIAGPVILNENDKEVSIPVRITLPNGKKIPKGSQEKGLHLGVTTKGGNKNWNESNKATLNTPPLIPPDKQSDYIATNNSTKGLTYYDFVWNIDNDTYRRYYVTSAQDSSFEVTINVRINKLDKDLVVRLLDRDLGEWLPHNSACEVPLTRKVPEPPKPAIDITKTIIDKPAFFNPGDTFTYLLQYRNTVNASVAENVVITDELDIANFTVVSVLPAEATVNSVGLLTYERGNLPFSREYQDIRITVRLKDEISSGSKVCNVSKIAADNTSSDFSESVCVSVITPCEFDDTIEDTNDPNCRAPKVVCEVVDYAVNRTTRRVTYRTTATSTNPKNTTIKGYDYDFGDDTEVSFDSSKYEHETTHTYAPGTFDTTVTVRYTTTGQSETEDQSYNCNATINFEEDQAVGQSKAVKNITQDTDGETAATTTVNGNDVLEYTLRTTNSQNYERIDIDVSDYIGDILDYATLDLEYLEEQGGTFEKETNKVVWQDVTIPANGEVLQSFRVKIKDPIPSTNSPSAMTTGYDCKISNEYGNEITINVDCPLVKGVETLPNTGPGASLAAMTGVTAVVGYFFSRSRLLAKEVEFVRQDYVATGGM